MSDGHHRRHRRRFDRRRVEVFRDIDVFFGGFPFGFGGFGFNPFCGFPLGGFGGFGKFPFSSCGCGTFGGFGGFSGFGKFPFSSCGCGF